MFELLSVQEPLLKESWYLYFTKGWGIDGKIIEDRFYEVDLTQQIGYDIARIIAVGSTYDVVFLDQGLVPENPWTLYEVLMGLKGNVLMYPRLPSTDWYLKLEKSGFVPDPTDAAKRYIGAYVEADSPYDKPKLRAYTIKDLEPPVLRLYTDSIEHEKAVLRFMVNRCKLKTVNAETEKRLRAKQLPFREIKHYSLMRY